MMKKFVVMLMLAGTMVLAACGDKNTAETGSQTDGVSGRENSDEADLEAVADGKDTEIVRRDMEVTEKEIDGIRITEDTIEEKGIEEFVTLKNYKGIALEGTLNVVTDEEVQEQVDLALQMYPLVTTDTSAEVINGDVVTIDFVGEIDGAAFDGGSAAGYSLEVGSQTFIDGFEEQLVGMKVGEERDVKVTFPKDYPSDEVKGKDAVFTVTLHQISRTLTEMTDEWALANTVYASADEYRQAIRDELEAEESALMGEGVKEEAWDAVFSEAEFTQIPKDMLETFWEEQIYRYESSAKQYEMDYEEYLALSDFTEESLLTEANAMLKKWMAAEYICVQEGITKDSEAYQNKVDELITANGYADINDAMAQGVTELDLEYTVKYNLAIDIILKYADISNAQN